MCIRDSPNRSKFNLKESTIEVAGVGQIIVGRHYDVIVLSDIVTPETVTTPMQIQKTKDWVAYAISLLHNPEKNRIDMEGTRYDFNDIYGEWEEKAKKDKRFFCYKRPAIIKDENGNEKPLFHERFTLEGVYAIKKDQGSYIFAGQYMLEPIDLETAPFKRSQIKYIERRHLPRVNNKLPPCFTTIDVAISKDKKADYSVITTSIFDSDGTEYVVDIQYGKWDTNELIDKIFKVNKRFQPEIIGIETVAFQKMLVNILYDI